MAVLSLSLGALLNSGSAQTTWVTNRVGYWETGTNWVGGVTPSGTTAIAAVNSGTATIHDVAAAVVKRVVVGTGGTVILESGTLQVTGGTDRSAGVNANGGTFTQTGGTLTQAGGGQKVFTAGLGGTVNHTGGSFTNAKLWIAEGAANWNIGGSAVFTLAGTDIHRFGADTATNVVVNQTGGSISSEVAGGSTLNMASGTGATLSWTISGGTLSNIILNNAATGVGNLKIAGSIPTLSLRQYSQGANDSLEFVADASGVSKLLASNVNGGTGNLTLNGSLSVDVGAKSGANSLLLLDYTGSLSGTFSSVSVFNGLEALTLSGFSVTDASQLDIGTYFLRYNSVDKDVILYYNIPEPSVCALAVLVGGIILARRRVRRAC